MNADGDKGLEARVPGRQRRTYYRYEVWVPHCGQMKWILLRGCVERHKAREEAGYWAHELGCYVQLWADGQCVASAKF